MTMTEKLVGVGCVGLLVAFIVLAFSSGVPPDPEADDQPLPPGCVWTNVKTDGWRGGSFVHTVTRVPVCPGQQPPALMVHP